MNTPPAPVPGLTPGALPTALLQAIAALQPSAQAQRLFHGRGGLHPGEEAWTLDAYPPVWLLTHYGPVDEVALAAVGEALQRRWAQVGAGQPLNLVFQQRDEVRADTRVLCGTVPEDHAVAEDGARYAVHLLRGFNHGLFLDMAEGRRWLRAQAAARPGARVLNLFAYTCAFSVAALQGGASQVLNVDMSPGALGIGKRNHALNGLSGRASFLPYDVWNSWGKLSRQGPYDLLVADPPAYQKGSFVAEKDWARLLRRLPGLLAPGGQALLALNAPRYNEDFLRQLLAVEAPALTVLQRLPNPPAFADVDPQRALKVLIVQAPGA
ncbi:class I SAM-dependent methyltransferase [Ideonella livida]|uniref:SAM-dependent methyltransferase n=1 Tax=Ideonella livida TaxID=2707176 RepID=A0A7C9TH64_9BURK|nr:class I SAM-dependent methyltransferase [Ideonella livida]NDY90321.1 SAM-dependent methyltransferase [Ideonella livida]